MLSGIGCSHPCTPARTRAHRRGATWWRWWLGG
jgi:hypothetical protein